VFAQKWRLAGEEEETVDTKILGKGLRSIKKSFGYSFYAGFLSFAFLLFEDRVS
jgi:hypothetical protein